MASVVTPGASKQHLHLNTAHGFVVPKLYPILQRVNRESQTMLLYQTTTQPAILLTLTLQSHIDILRGTLNAAAFADVNWFNWRISLQWRYCDFDISLRWTS